MTKWRKYVTIYGSMKLSAMALMDTESSKLEISRVLMARVQQAAFEKALNEANMLILLEVGNP
jgi:hypothetical protein